MEDKSDATLPLQRCPACGKNVPSTTDYFARNRSRKTGLTTWCKACLAARSKQWYYTNRAKVLDKHRRAPPKTPAYRAWVREYQRTSPKVKAWRERNRERIRAQSRAAYQRKRATMPRPVIQPPAMRDRDEIVRWHDQEGLTFAQIGQRLGITRQRAWQLYHSADRSHRREEDRGMGSTDDEG